MSPSASSWSSRLAAEAEGIFIQPSERLAEILDEREQLDQLRLSAVELGE